MCIVSYFPQECYIVESFKGREEPLTKITVYEVNLTQESEIYKYSGKHVGNIVTESQTATVLDDVWGMGMFP